HKIRSSWQGGGLALIPERKDMTVDADTVDGLRRFFIVDLEARTAKYAREFETHPVKRPTGFSTSAATAAFDTLWEAFDRNYAMFAIRPEVDWAKSREEFRPRALTAKSTAEFAETCAEMLRPLRDLHVWLRVGGNDVPVFNRKREANSNPSAHEAILRTLSKPDRAVQWTVTPDKIGYIAILEWSGDQ